MLDSAAAGDLDLDLDLDLELELAWVVAAGLATAGARRCIRPLAALRGDGSVAGRCDEDGPVLDAADDDNDDDEEDPASDDCDGGATIGSAWSSVPCSLWSCWRGAKTSWLSSYPFS
jgi:hypothetical protein